MVTSPLIRPFLYGKAGFSLMGGSWEEAYPKSQKQIFQKPTLPIKLDPLKFVPLNSYWREGGFQNLRGWGAPQKICFKMGDGAISNICLIHKIALVWSVPRNIFQPMDYAERLAVQLKNIFLIFLKHSAIHSALLEAKSPPFLPKTTPHLKLVEIATTGIRFLIKNIFY